MGATEPRQKMTEEYEQNHDQVQLFIDIINKITVDEMKRVVQKYRTFTNASANAFTNASANASAKASASAFTNTSASAKAFTNANAKAYEYAFINAYTYANAMRNTTLALVVRGLISTEDFEIIIEPCRFILERLGIVEPKEES